MTTGRINQVRAVGGAGAPAAPRPAQGARTGVRAPRGPASRRALSSFVGRRAAPARSGRLRTPGRVSPRLGGARLRPGRGPSGPGGVAPAGARSPTPGLRRPRLAGPRPRLLLSPSQSRSAAASQRQAIIKLIQKPGKDSRYVNGWRPISLLNVDIKVVSKVLVNRLVPLLPKIIKPDQYAFVKGRFIGEPERLIWDILNYMKRENQAGIMFGADLESAFDLVDHDFMFAVMKKLGFQGMFIKWVKLLHKNISSTVINNGFSTGYFRLTRGTRQGDPLAAYLFIIVIEVLACLIRNNENIQGVIINKVQIKLCMFADDTTVFVDGIESLKHVLDSLEIFETYSSLHINTNKSEAACIGADRDSNVNCFGLKWVNLCQSYIKILGVCFSYCQNIIHKENFVKAENNVRTALNLWKGRQLTIFGRTEVVRTLAISKLMYLFNLLDPPESTVQYLKKLLSDFVWQGKKPKIKFTTLIAPNEMGGIRFPDIESRVKVQRIQWVKRILSFPQGHLWAIINSYMEPIGGLKTLNNISKNFDCMVLPLNLPKFYIKCFKEWASYMKTDPKSIQEILGQCIWNNSFIKPGGRPVFYNDMSNRNINHIYNMLDSNGSWKNTNSQDQGNFYMHWISVFNSIPTHWKDKINQNVDEVVKHLQILSTQNMKTGLQQSESKDVYYNIIVNKCHYPTSQSYFKQLNNLNNVADLNWELWYQSFYEISPSTYMREFQYKIMNNILPLNKRLY